MCSTEQELPGQMVPVTTACGTWQYSKWFREFALRRLVMPPGFAFPYRDTQVWLPLGIMLKGDPREQHANHYLQVVGRLRPGANVEQARAYGALGRDVLAHLADRFPHQLSGGQQQRVAIARALAMSPGILLCDEITSALDPELVGEVLGVVESLAREGMTLLMVTHEMNFARKVSDRVIFMHQGRVHEQGAPEALFGQPRTHELQQFLSSLH